MIILFLIYPKRLRYSVFFGKIVSVFFGAWALLLIGDWLPAWAGINLLTAVEMLVICSAIGLQYRATRGKADLRASLVYLGLAVLLGAGIFIALNALPLVMGKNAAVGQEYGFLSFLIIYAGLAAGISRYRLFEVGRWGFNVLFYGLGGVLLVGFDGFLIFKLKVDRTPAFAFSLFIIGFLYLPLRDRVRRRLSSYSKIKPEEIVDLALGVAFAVSLDERMSAWYRALDTMFQPLEIRPATAVVDGVRIDASGLSLTLPELGGIRSLALNGRSSGRLLFNQESVGLADKLIQVLIRAQTQREAYDRGAQEERQRMAQDLHDDIGSRLLTMVHNSEKDKRHELQSILGDLRALVNEISVEKVRLNEVLAEVRFETSTRLQAAGIQVKWLLDDDLSRDGSLIGIEIHKAIRSGIRELISNAIHHSQATEVALGITRSESGLSISVSDNGRGRVERGSDREGFGLKSLEIRIARAKGQIKTDTSERGFNVAIHLPLEHVH